MNPHPGLRPPRTFDTQRLHLRPMGPGDAVAIFETYASREDATRYMDFARHCDLSRSQAFAARCADCWDTGTAFPWALLDRRSGAFAGAIELRLSPPSADFGYIFGSVFWSRGLATEAAGAVTAWVTTQPSIMRLWATCHPENRASVRVLEKVGLRFEAIVPDHLVRPQLDSAASSSLMFAWTRDAQSAPAASQRPGSPG